MTANNPNSTSRRWLYGFNSAIIVLVAVVALVFIDYLTATMHKVSDRTIGHVNSLSQQSEKLLENIDQKGQKFEMLSLFSSKPSGGESRDEEVGLEDRTKQVSDLLENYTRASKHITLASVTSQGDLAAKIQDRYKAEVKPYDEVLQDFPALVTSLQNFCKAQADLFGARSLQAGLSADEQKDLLAVQSVFASRLPETLGKIRSDVARLTTDATMPEWSKATALLSRKLDDVVSFIDPLTNLDPKEVDPVLGKFFKDHAAEYKKISETVHAYKDRIDKLAPLKMDEVMESIEANCIVVLGPNAVKVIPPSEVYKRQGQGRGASDSTFEGEQAVTSALLALSETNKPKVVFVTASPQQLMMSSYSEITGRLQKSNYEVLEWSPAPMPPGGGEAPPMPSAPPAMGKDVVWIVFPPEAPNMQMMMAGMPTPDPRPFIEAVKKHVDAGGAALFLAEANAGMFGAPSGGYPFAELIKPFGVEVQSKYTAVQLSDQDGSGKMIAMPKIEFTTYPNTPITEALQSMRTIFFPQGSRSGELSGKPTVVTIADNKPQGVHADVIVRTPNTDMIWASASPNVDSGEAKFEKDKDLAAPLSMGVSAESTTGQRVVVLGSKFFASNPALYALAIENRNGQRVAIPAFPGNSELFLNSVYWLSGNKNMIGVGPQARVAERIAAMSPQKEFFLRAGAFAIPPFLAVLIGIFVFVIRHR